MTLDEARKKLNEAGYVVVPRQVWEKLREKPK